MGQPLTKESVPLRTGPPTKDELMVHYPAKFTWEQLKIFVNSGDLGTLKRDRALQKRYDEWAEGIKAQYGSMVSYLVNHRLRWGQLDTMSLLKSSLDFSRFISGEQCATPSTEAGIEPHLDPPYFSIKTPSKYISLIQNDWPYSVPPEIEHSLIWTKLPIYHPLLVAGSIEARVGQDGLCGFTGVEGPPEMPEDIASCLGALSEWGVTPETLIRSSPPTAEEVALLQKAATPVHEYVKTVWVEDEWETAWFVNPPRLQSVPGLAHIHVFAKRK
ncbi:hypothetical protein D9619_007355 [Psilocybe cf. subviscida]|uniref:Uncharacterized protein n=1 Tax=Psilocybe cf. subviscida TaxID=2480587 RepID=A0A8H5B1Y2_9AGAR|nr:hypothetical protein D9619_007355 [Psilocybe cf. subviscida]